MCIKTYKCESLTLILDDIAESYALGNDVEGFSMGFYRENDASITLYHTPTLAKLILFKGDDCFTTKGGDIIRLVD